MSNFIRGNLPKCVSVYNAENSFNFDIDILPLPDFTSVVFSAMAFALWTCPKRIYLVGCDCSKGHFGTGKEDTISNEHLVRYWIKLKDFAKEYYPNTEIISINPVGLKGLFREELG